MKLLFFLVLLFCLPLMVLAQDPMEFAPFMVQRDQTTTDWSQRVVANGGAQPSQNTVNAMETLRTTLIAQGITNKLYSLCIFVPDSIIAATTPLFYHLGADPWTNGGFVSGDLTIEGLKGDAATKFLDTGCDADDIRAADGSVGLTVIVSEGATVSMPAPTAIGSENDAGSNSEEIALLIGISAMLWVPGDGQNAANYIITNDVRRVGYVSGNRNDTDTAFIFVASPLEEHKLVSVKSNVFLSTAADHTVPVFCRRKGFTNEAGTFTSTRLSAALIHDGFTQTESSNVWVALRTCRETLGGGTGDPIHDYNLKVTAAGGANISTTTSNALRTFYSGLDTDGTLDLMGAVNCIVPDNLTAARTPVVWKTGSQVWTNFNFAASNLSVAGLQGVTADSKYLGTGIVPSTANRISATSGGMTAIVTDNPGTVSLVPLGGNPATANVQCSLILSTGGADSILFRMWRNDVVNANFLSTVHPSPGDTWTGYISGNRTGASAIALYVASTTLSHQVLTNGTGAQTGTAAACTIPMLSFANNNNGTPANFANHTMSFVAFHGGLTQTQSSNLYNRISTFRAAVGGGNP